MTIFGGGSGADLERGGSHAIFEGAANVGRDNITNYGSNVLIEANSRHDYIYNHGSKVTIDGGYEDDKIYNSGSNNIINGDGKIIFEDVIASTKFNINGTNYKISGSKLK